MLWSGIGNCVKFIGFVICLKVGDVFVDGCIFEGCIVLNYIFCWTYITVGVVVVLVCDGLVCVMICGGFRWGIGWIFRGTADWVELAAFIFILYFCWVYIPSNHCCELLSEKS